MDKEQLTKARDLVKQQISNLSNYTWLIGEINQLQGKYTLLDEIIGLIEKEKEGQDATSSKNQQANSNNNKGK